ncbi:MAG TPA: acetate--CoA ligase family protein, partial [Anaerolineaceae bacterium]
TGALAGAETAYDAAFARAGILRANTTEELFQWAKALAYCPRPRGPRVVVLTNSGGPGVAATDALEAQGLMLARLSEETRAALRAILPPFASVNNPVDMIASATVDQFAGCLQHVLADPGVDMVMVISPPPPPTTTGAVVKAMIPLIQTSDKPVIVTLMGDRLIAEGVELLRAANIPEYRFPEQSASALAALWRRAQLLERMAEDPCDDYQVDRARAAELLAGAAPGEFLSQDAAAGLLQAYGISTLAPVFAANANEAATAAERLGFPVVVKLDSPDITHKSDVGGVALNLETAAAVAGATVTVMRLGREARPDARINGVQVQKMLGAGQEVILGMVRDPQFGPLMMFGSGGVEVEGLKDVAFSLAPLSVQEAGRMLDSTWAGRKLAGFRNLAPADRSAVIDALVRLAQLAMDFPQIQEIEVNPLRAMGEGAWVIDARARI